MKKINSILKLAGLAACLLAAAHGALQAGAPLKINFQGRLDESGQPAEGSKSFTFKIYDVSSGGTPVWTSAAQSLALSRGVFSASLAAGSPAALSTGTFTGARYVEITVDGVTLSPRQEMVSAPYALVAQALAPDAVVPQGTILAASVTDYHVLLTTGAVASGKFTDNRVYISTGAFYGGFGGADQLVQLDNSGKLPGIDGSALTSLNPSNLSGAVAAAKGGTGLTAPGTSGNLLRSDGTTWTSWTPAYLASYTETDPVFLAQKGAASGVAPLGANAKLNTDYLAGTIVSTHIADASIGTADLAGAVFNLGNFTAGTLGTDYLAGTLVSSHIANGTILNADLAASGFDAAKITAGKLNTDYLAGTIVSTHIADASIGTADLAGAVFNLGNFTAGTLGTDYLAGTLVSTHIANGTILNADLAAAGFDAAKITAGKLNTDYLAGTIVSTHIADASIGTADLAGAVFNLGNFTAGTLGTDYLAGTLVSTHIANGTILNADLADSGFDAAKITAGKLNTDYLAGTIVSTHIADASIGTADLAGAVFNLGNFTAGTLGTDFLAGTLVSTHIANGTILNADLADSGFDAAKITAGKLNTDYLAGTIVSTHIAAGGISVGKIAVAVSTITFAENNYNVTGNDSTILIWATGLGSNVTVNLPDARTVVGRSYTFKRMEPSPGNTIAIHPYGGQQIEEPAGDYLLPNQYQTVTLQSIGDSWVRLFYN